MRTTPKQMVAMLAVSCLAMLGMYALPANAAYPEKPLTLVVPFPPGGAVDTLGRIFADSIGRQTGQKVIVENRAGANGNIGTETVVRAAPDGYTLLIGANGVATNPAVYPKRAFNEVKDLAPVAYIGYAPLILVVARTSPFSTFDDLLTQAKAKPGSISFATSGSGSAPHLASELLKITAKADMLHVPYKGGSPAKLDLVSGRVSFMFLNPLEAVPQIDSGKLRALMVDSDKRIPQLPDVPTAKELGYADLEAKVWWGFFVPKATDSRHIQSLNGFINQALQDPGVQEKLRKMAIETGGGSVASFETYYAGQVKKWAAVVKAANLAQ
jgi:tripartite-type tricarboxylate transporter receptor subunit TctC